jgi:hypothetical protein
MRPALAAISGAGKAPCVVDRRAAADNGTRDLIAYLIGLVVERSMLAASLPAFLAMYFLCLWVAWVLAVRLTQPKVQLR